MHSYHAPHKHLFSIIMNISFLHLSVIIFQHHILHESLHHHGYAFNKNTNNKTKWLNMVPNACLTKKGCFFGHLNLIITFSMHSMRIPESFVPMKCWWSIGDQNCHFLGYGVEPSSCFYEKVHQIKLKHGSNHLAKNWGRRWIGLHRCFVYCQTHLGLLMSLLLPVSTWRRGH